LLVGSWARRLQSQVAAGAGGAYGRGNQSEKSAEKVCSLIQEVRELRNPDIFLDE
jgi:hypothetical protein